MNNAEIKSEVDARLSVLIAKLEVAQAKDIITLTKDILSLKELVMSMFAGEEKARKILSLQNEDHFQELNHAKATAIEMERKYVEKVSYVSDLREVTGQIKVLTSWKDIEVGKHVIANYISFGAFIIAIISLVLRLL